MRKHTEKRTLVMGIIIVLLARKRKVLYLNTTVPKNMLPNKKEILCSEKKYNNCNISF